MVDHETRSILGEPGQLYNNGNLLVLAGGIGGAVCAAVGEGADLTAAAGRVAHHFLGAPSAVALTIATLVFVVGGAAYSRAWRNAGSAPDPRFNRWGDVLSGVGAVILGAGLTMLGDATLAIFAGLLHAGGKFGSAFAGPRRIRIGGGAVLLADVCKDAVLVSRVPALAAAFIGLTTTVVAFGPIGEMVLALSVTVSTLYWALADILLLRRDGPLMTGIRRILGEKRGRSAAE
jgi:hypothetical protein